MTLRTEDVFMIVSPEEYAFFKRDAVIKLEGTNDG